MEEISTDILIVGAGVAGSALAAALKNSPFHITIIDPRKPGSDLNRGDVLYPASLEIIHDWGVLPLLMQKGLLFTTLKAIHKTNTLFEIDLTTLNPTYPYGLSIDHTLIEDTLLDFAHTENVSVMRGVSALEMQFGSPHQVTVIGNNTKTLIKPTLIVGADGRNSKVRNSMGLPSSPTTFDKDMVVCWAPLKGEFPVGVYSFVQPPEALLAQVLPPGNRLRLAISVPKGQASAWINKPASEKHEYLRSFSSEFPEIEPVFTGEHIYVLRAQNAPTYYGNGVVLMGDAAHEIHPLSSQGIGMALADACVLGKILDNSFDNLPDKLSAYETIRRPNAQKVINHSTFVAKALTQESPPAVEVEKIMTFLLEHSSPLRNLFTKELIEFEYENIGKAPKIPHITDES
jgi:2-polyprenyl-6-methoxyphenol hydroxylase-like FAD-dependent oxidoreductase